MPDLQKPSLVVAPPGATQPKLRARRCACGLVCFPPQPFGCERCGRSGDALAEAELEARGVLTAFAAVHVHTKRPVPYLVGRIALDAGPSIEARLAASDAWQVGMRVVGTLGKAVDASGAEAFECLFAPEEA